MVEHFTNWMDLTILGSLLHYLISIRPHAGEIWTKSYGPNYTKFWSLWQKKKKKKKKRVNHFWQSADANLEDVSMTDTIVWCKTINVKTIIFQCSKNYGTSRHV